MKRLGGRLSRVILRCALLVVNEHRKLWEGRFANVFLSSDGHGETGGIGVRYGIETQRNAAFSVQLSCLVHVVDALILQERKLEFSSLQKSLMYRCRS